MDRTLALIEMQPSKFRPCLYLWPGSILYISARGEHNLHIEIGSLTWWGSTDQPFWKGSCSRRWVISLILILWNYWEISVSVLSQNGHFLAASQGLMFASERTTTWVWVNQSMFLDGRNFFVWKRRKCLTGISRPLDATSVATITAELSALNLSRALRRCRCCMEACRATTGICSSFKIAASLLTVDMAFAKTRVRPECWVSK